MTEKQTDIDGKPLVWCSTCREEHAEGAPHFKYAIRSDPEEPIILGEEASKRLDEIMESPSGSLPDPPLPIDEE